MSERLKIRSKFLTASDTAKVLGVSQSRADQLMGLLKDAANGSSTKSKGRARGKSRVKTSALSGGQQRSSGFKVGGTFKKASLTKDASKSNGGKEALKKASARRYASKQAVAKKG